MIKTSKLWAVVLCLLFCNAMVAQSVSKMEADMVASRFVSEKYMSKSKEPVDVIYKGMIADDTMTYMYQYDIDGVGFVFVSASKAVPAVLAYSLDENFEMIPPVRDLFHLYKQEIRYAEKSKLEPTAKAAAQWAHYLAPEFSPRPAKNGDDRFLLTTRWNQNKYYNTYCPWDVQAGPYYDYRVPNGCVALACSQIMNYHHYPHSGKGIISYIPHGYPRQTVYYSRHQYHWEAMCDQPEFYANEIAKLAYHMGVAIQMNYNYDGSGANTDRAKTKLYEVFGYDQSITSYYRGNYLDTAVAAYIRSLKAEIDNRHPIYYSGCTAEFNSCHAYVLDGYDNEDKFHLNYGWGGSSNGFYEIDNFTAGASQWDFSAEAILNIFPSNGVPDEYCQGHQRLTASFGYVMDGSPTAKPYQANPDCSWMVAVPGATKYRFSFDRLELNPDVDYVTIYNGPTVGSGVKATFTGTTLPTNEIVVNADSVLITFTSTGNGPAVNTDYYGFLMQYSTTLPSSSCSYSTNIHDWTRELTDGTPENENYQPEVSCTWNIALNYISGFSYNFSKFDLGYGDFVDIYDATSNPPTLYKRYDIYDEPHGIEHVSFNKMRVHFVSDNWDQKEGFKFRYYALASVDNYSGIENLSIYPNPVSDVLFVKYSVKESGNVTFRLMDMTGKQVLVDAFEALAGDNSQMVNVSGLKAGLYLLEMTTSTGRMLQKVLVQ